MLGAHHFFGRGSYQQPWVGEPNYYGNIGNPSNPPLLQRRRYAALQDVYTLGPTWILSLNFSILYQYGQREAWSYGYDITQLGFPANFRDGQQVRAFPVTTLTGFSGLGNSAHNYSTQTVPMFEVGVSKIFSRQRLKAGRRISRLLQQPIAEHERRGHLQFLAGVHAGAESQPGQHDRGQRHRLHAARPAGRRGA